MSLPYVGPLERPGSGPSSKNPAPNSPPSPASWGDTRVVSSWGLLLYGLAAAQERQAGDERGGGGGDTGREADSDAPPETGRESRRPDTPGVSKTTQALRKPLWLEP